MLIGKEGGYQTYHVEGWTISFLVLVVVALVIVGAVLWSRRQRSAP